MHTNSPFGGCPPSNLVDRLIGRSYEVVKDVYLHLPILKKLDESIILKYIYEHFSTIEELNRNAAAIQTVADNLYTIFEVPNWLTRITDASNTQISNINALGNSVKSAINTLAQNKTNEFNNLYSTNLSSFLNTVSNSVSSINTQTTTSINSINQTKDNVINDIIHISNQVQVDLNQAKEDTLTDFTETITEQTREYTEQIREAASRAMFSYRYCDQRLESFQTYPQRILHPTSEIKAGDHVVTWQGEVFEITSYDPHAGLEGEFTVGPYLHSIRGAKGEKGDTGVNALAVTVQGYCHTKAEFDELVAQGKIVGKPGYAYIIANEDTPEYDPSLMIWIPQMKQWVEQKDFCGPAGASFNDVLMDPDPLEYFIHVYGYTLEEYYGMLLVTIKDDGEPMVNASYSSFKIEQLLKNLKNNYTEITTDLQNQVTEINNNLNTTNNNLTELDERLTNSIQETNTNLTEYIDNSINTTITNISTTLENDTNFKANIENQVNEILESKGLNQDLVTDLDSLAIKFDYFVMRSAGADFVKMFEDTLIGSGPAEPPVGPSEPETEGDTNG